MKCVVTGAAGFIGSSIVDRLLQSGHSVIGIDAYVPYYPRPLKEKNIISANKDEKYTFIEGDLNHINLAEVLVGAEWVFHQAAQAGVRSSWGKEFEIYSHNNVLASQALLEALKGSPTLKKIVYASSSSIYGDAESYPTTEDMLPRPLSPYGVTKLAAEHLMGLYAKEFQVPTVSLRYFTVYGPRQRPDMAFNKFIQAALTGKEITLYGTGEQMRDFTYIDDIVTANIRAAEAGQSGSVYNIGGGTNATVNEVLDIIKSEVGTLKITRYDRQRGEAFRTSADTSRARADFGFSPSISLEAGIHNEIAWLRETI